MGEEDAVMISSALRLEPLSDHFGARVADWPVTSFGTDDAEEIRHLLYERQVLAFPGQSLAPEQLLAFGRIFGDLQRHVLQQFTLPGFPEIYVLSNEIVDGKEIGNRNIADSYHTDFSYMRRTTAYTILYAVKVSPVGGNTLFATTYASYERLPEDKKQELSKLQVVFSYRSLYRHTDNRVPLTAEQLARTPNVKHPMVRTHPHTGRRGLYLGSEEVTGIDGVSVHAASAMLRDLMDYATSPEFVLSYRWSPGDLVIWDNRGLLHSGTPYDRDKYVRTIYRVSIEGEEPS
jgi:taurine dioxygenase